MFVDFSGLAMDQICNQAAKLRLMTGGQCKVPMVVRMPQGGGAGKSTAAQHSQSLEVWYAHIPGLKVVHPSTPYDAKGLMKAAIRDDNPVIFLEHKFLYAFRGLVPEEDYVLSLSQCDVKREGTDVTVVASGYMVWHGMLAARMLAEEGISVEVVDVRTISPLDEDTIGRSVRKTGRAVVVAEACRSYGPTGEWGMVVMEQAFDYLRAPIMRVTGRNSPVPFADSIEDGQWPDTDDVLGAIRKVMAW
jgi:pyruvate/2-oxoglutarate/acetoin dehydrogenase E1 component